MMQRYEYRVIQATDIHPKGFWRKALERTASAMTERLNEQGRDGWEFQRAELLRMQMRGRWGGSAEQEVDVLIFRRPVNRGGSELDIPESTDGNEAERNRGRRGAARPAKAGQGMPPLSRKERGSS